MAVRSVSVGLRIRSTWSPSPPGCAVPAAQYHVELSVDAGLAAGMATPATTGGFVEDGSGGGLVSGIEDESADDHRPDQHEGREPGRPHATSSLVPAGWSSRRHTTVRSTQSQTRVWIASAT